MKAFIFDPIWDDLIDDELKAILDKSGLEVIVTKELAPLKECGALYEGSEERILCLNPDYVKWELLAEDYKNIPNLKAIMGAATATHWIDASFANENNIAICDIRGFSSEAVAEWVMLTMFCLARQIPRLVKDGFPLDFDKDFMKYRGVELHGKKVGFVGLGNIGSAIAKRCVGLGMEVSYWARSDKKNTYKYTDLKELFSESDVIIPAMSTNEESKKIITEELLGTMKASAILVQFVEDLFDEKLVIDMVEAGKLFGFGFEAKSASFDKYNGNVWAAPAYGWVTDTTMHNSMVKWVDNMVDASKGKFPNKVN